MPSGVEADHETVAFSLPAVALGVPGAVGTPAGMTVFDGVEAADVPAPLCATTVNEYCVPLVRSSTVQCSAESDTGEQLCPPGAAVTV